MPASRKNVRDTLRDITRKALERGEVDRAARAASGMLAGIADSLSTKKPRRR